LLLRLELKTMAMANGTPDFSSKRRKSPTLASKSSEGPILPAEGTSKDDFWNPYIESVAESTRSKTMGRMDNNDCKSLTIQM